MIWHWHDDLWAWMYHFWNFISAWTQSETVGSSLPWLEIGCLKWLEVLRCPHKIVIARCPIPSIWEQLNLTSVRNFNCSGFCFQHSSVAINVQCTETGPAAPPASCICIDGAWTLRPAAIRVPCENPTSGGWNLDIDVDLTAIQNSQRDPADVIGYHRSRSIFSRNWELRDLSDQTILSLLVALLIQSLVPELPDGIQNKTRSQRKKPDLEKPW